MGLLLLAMASTWLTSCLRQTVYYRFAHTSLSGWEKNDVIEYGVSPMAEDCTLSEEVLLRTNILYPFQKLTLVLEQEIVPTGSTRRDTVECVITDREGVTMGEGTGVYTYGYRLADLQLARGDSLHIRLRHNMKREILPGIADVGIRLWKR